MRLPPDLLMAAYARGIFPMDVDGEIEWFSPDPRAILPLDQLRISRTLARMCRRGAFEIRLNTVFLEVMRRCGEREEGTWISPEIIEGYCELHRLGLAHSVESWQGGALAGGLYGVSLGGAFFGESMFHRVRDASKVALVALVERLHQRGFTLLDVQFMTEHLRQFGAVEIRRREYLRRLAPALALRCSFEDTP
jgi:leucyl/phenylalanyl-tRNA---protein transferase